METSEISNRKKK